MNRQAHRPRPDRRPGINVNIPRHSNRMGEQAKPASWQWKVSPLRVRPPKLELPKHPAEVDLRGLGNTELPIYKHRQQIIDAVEKNRVITLSGETGSGKTTQTWQYLVGEGYYVIVLLPRRVIVDNLYGRAVDELAEQRGAEVASDILGMVHSERNITSDTNKVTFMTPGTYLRMIPSLKERYSGKDLVVVSDEIHEANFPMEMATAEVASMLEAEPTWRLVVSSATHDRTSIDKALTPVNGKDIPFVEIDGRPHNVELHEIPNMDIADIYVEYGGDHASTIIFTSGKAEIEEVIEKIRVQLDGKGLDNVVFRKLHAGITEYERKRLEDQPPEGMRFVTVSTNAGQSGITLPGVTLVIADGEAKRKELDDDGSVGLARRLSSRDELTQQAGRAGRDVEGGVFYHGRPISEGSKFVSWDSHERADHAPPEIYAQHLGRSALMMLALGRDLEGLNRYAMHRVKDEPIRSAYRSIYELGAVDAKMTITSLGRQMDKLAPSPELSRAVVEAWQGGRSLPNLARVAMIAASIEAGGLAYFAHDAGNRWTELLRETTSDDMIAQLDLFIGIQPYFDGRKFNERELYDLDIDPKNAHTAYKQWFKMMRAMGVNPHNLDLPPSTLDEEEEIRDCLLAGMVGTIYRRSGSAGRGYVSTYRALRNNEGNGMVRDRLLSGRSVYKSTGDDGELLAALPRWYEKVVDNDGGVERIYIVEQVMPVPKAKLARYVAGLLTSESKGTEVRNGKVVDIVQRKFGDLEIGGEIELRPSQLTREASNVLYKYVQNNPGNSLRELRSLIRQVADLMKLVPVDERKDYFNETNITRARVDALLREAVRECDNADDVDIWLRLKMYEQNLNLSHWISDENAEAISARSPVVIRIEGLARSLKLDYRNGLPVATGLRVSDIKFLPEDVRLDDGREVRFQVMSAGKKILVNASEAKSRIFV